MIGKSRRVGGIGIKSSLFIGGVIVVFFLSCGLRVLCYPLSSTQTTVGQLRWLGNEATVGQVRLLGKVVAKGLNFDGLREVE